MAVIVTIKPNTVPVYEIRGFEHLIHATYIIPPKTSIATAGLGRGQDFPADSDYKITESKIVLDKHGLASQVKVTAYKHELEA